MTSTFTNKLRHILQTHFAYEETYKISTNSDTFSIGVILYECASKFSTDQQKKTVLSKLLELDGEDKMIEINQLGATDVYKKIMLQLFDRQPSNRPSAEMCASNFSTDQQKKIVLSKLLKLDGEDKMIEINQLGATDVYKMILLQLLDRQPSKRPSAEMARS
ncbi:hypothetical protein F8388_002027 [Cannabis sativa]|uniref:Serine-threonine/tyrosine-protein kinase catalytic domain-containing protein n=1 Tax=Cannabis sativa TaxID=3483 RepID=A0A7J6HBH9_CANSA|nr:hypothetical protein F8388_002027 [Cannabis sativa]KAF4391890.1 hypothetical protein G4B88_007465 [Cannabis sativa]